MIKLRSLALAAAAMFATGCTLIPEYERPEVQVPQAWPEGPAYVQASENDAAPASTVGWRDFFIDPQLKGLIERALENSPDARIAALNVERTRARYRIQRAELAPGGQRSGQLYPPANAVQF